MAKFCKTREQIAQEMGISNHQFPGLETSFFIKDFLQSGRLPRVFEDPFDKPATVIVNRNEVNTTWEIT